MKEFLSVWHNNCGFVPFSLQVQLSARHSWQRTKISQFELPNFKAFFLIVVTTLCFQPSVVTITYCRQTVNTVILECKIAEFRPEFRYRLYARLFAFLLSVFLGWNCFQLPLILFFAVSSKICWYLFLVVCENLYSRLFCVYYKCSSRSLETIMLHLLKLSDVG